MLAMTWCNAGNDVMQCPMLISHVTETGRGSASHTWDKRRMLKAFYCFTTDIHIQLLTPMQCHVTEKARDKGQTILVEDSYGIGKKKKRGLVIQDEVDECEFPLIGQLCSFHSLVIFIGQLCSSLSLVSCVLPSQWPIVYFPLIGRSCNSSSLVSCIGPSPWSRLYA